ncbi:K(+)-transporting ATPase subunit F [Parasegetibacter sp. NRK P23]
MHQLFRKHLTFNFNTMMTVLLIVSILVFIYLVYVLLKPEKF